MGKSNSIVGVINFSTFLISIPILGGGIWLSTKASSSDCVRFLEWPLIIIGVSIMVISLMGFAGACYRISCLLRLYFIAMFIVIVTLIGFIIFAFAVTSKGSGRQVMNKNYLDYYLSDYNGWLKERVSDSQYWSRISSCVRDTKVCTKIGRGFNTFAESPDMFYRRHLTPIESGCCKPLTSCGYTYLNETFWVPQESVFLGDQDCVKWRNDQNQLCYSCDSCKAGVLASLKRSWRKVSVVNIAAAIALVIVYVIGCAAFKNNLRIDNDEPHGQTRITKAGPS